MPRGDSPLDMVEHHLQRAAALLRDMQLADLEVEQHRTAVYQHVADAINICANYSYSLPPALSLPAVRTGRGGDVGRRAAKSPDLPKLNFKALLADDLEFLK